MNYIATIGLETHVQLKTASKIWCGCRNTYGRPPNSEVCPVCLGYPGTMPVLNEEAVRLTALTGFMLGCRVSTFSKWDRKSYFYPDMPKNYQISQYDLPLCEGGTVTIEIEGETRDIRLVRIHLEEDVGKSTHTASGSLLDFNRAGTPLMEIVSEPDLHSADETFAYLQALKQILLYGDISDANLEEGNIRCDINCSVQPEGAEGLGTKTEIKNMNTFRGVHRALTYEIKRQVSELKKGRRIVQETRRWDDEAGVTTSMRSKEDAHDYRYLPEPDLVPVRLEEAMLATWRESLPELPRERRARLCTAYGLPAYDAGVLAADQAVADFFEAAASQSDNPKAVSNWVMTELLRALTEQEMAVSDLRITPAALAELVALVDDKTLNSNTAKEVFQQLFDEGGRPADVVEARGLKQVSDSGAIEELAEQVLSEHPGPAQDYRDGKKAALQFLVGQVMRLSKGKANPKMAAEVLVSKLGSP